MAYPMTRGVATDPIPVFPESFRKDRMQSLIPLRAVWSILWISNFGGAVAWAAPSETCSKAPRRGSLTSLYSALSKQTSTPFTCPSWIKQKQNLPACPKGGGPVTLPETFPKAFTFFGMITNEESMFEIMDQTASVNPDRLPVFAGPLGDDTRKTLLERLKAKHPHLDWENHIVSVYVGPSNDATYYIRDPFHSRVKKDGTMEVFRTKSGYEITDAMRTLFAECGINSETTTDSNKNEEHYDQTTLGGNFLTFLPGIHVSTELTPIHEQSGWTEKNTIQIDALTNVRHIDEILQPIKTEFDKDGCPKVTALIADPDKALDLIRKSAEKNAKTQAFDLTFSGVGYDHEAFNQEYEKFQHSRNMIDFTRYMIGPMLDKGIDQAKTVNGFHQICSQIANLPDGTGLDFNLRDYQEVTLTFGEKRSKIFSLDEEQKPHETITLPKGYTDAQYQEALAKCQAQPYCSERRSPVPPMAPKPCAALSMADFYKILKHTPYNQAQTEALRKQTADLRKTIEERVSKKYPGCKNTVDWISSPVILKDGSWALPNSTNALPVAPGSVGIPDPYIRPFKDHLEKELASRNIRATWFDTLGLNNFPKETKTGNLHCSTNSIPICGKGK